MKGTLLIVFITALNSLSAQNKMQHSVFAEGGGAAVVGSLNYDFRLSGKQYTGLGIRLGLGMAEGFVRINPATYEDGWYGSSFKLTYPVGINYLFGNESSPHTLELGVNTVFVPKETVFDTWGDLETKSRTIPSITFGYRRQPVRNGFLWKIAFNPFMQDREINFWLGAGVGYKF